MQDKTPDNSDMLAVFDQIEVDQEPEIPMDDKAYCERMQAQCHAALRHLKTWHDRFRSEAEKYSDQFAISYSPSGSVEISLLVRQDEQEQNEFKEYYFYPFKIINNIADNYRRACYFFGSVIMRYFEEKAELKKLLDKPIDIPRLAQVRDIFGFCCLTGLAFSDVKQLRPEHITIDINGLHWIRKPRQKTGSMCNIPIMDAAQEILSRYTANAYCQTHGVLLPVCSNQKMNVYLKELADICGIRKHLSTHTARHTFATLTLASGATIENVAKMLGHSDTKMTRHYARILDSSILRDMQTVAKNMAL